MRAHNTLIPILILSLAIAGCARKVAEQPVSIRYSPSPPVLKEKVYYARPKCIVITKLSHKVISDKKEDSLKRKPTRRTTLFGITSDSVNPEKFQGTEVKNRIAKAKKLLEKEEKLVNMGKRKNPRVLGIYSLIASTAGVLFYDVFIGSILDYVVAWLSILGFAGLLVFLIKWIVRRFNRWRAVFIIKNAPRKSESESTKITNQLESLEILKYHLRINKLKRILTKMKPKVYGLNQPDQIARYKRLEDYFTAEWNKNEKSRKMSKRIRNVLVIVLLLFCLMLFKDGN